MNKGSLPERRESHKKVLVLPAVRVGLVVEESPVAAWELPAVPSG